MIPQTLEQALRAADAPVHVGMVAHMLADAVRVRLVFRRVYGPDRGPREWRAWHLKAAIGAARECREVGAMVLPAKRGAWAFVAESAAQQGIADAAKVVRP